MKSHYHLLQLNLPWNDLRFALLSFLSATVVTLIIIPPLNQYIQKKGLFDQPGMRKEHTSPIPTMGGIAIFAGMIIALFLWFPFESSVIQVSFFFSITALLLLGMMDDLRDLSAKYKLAIQLALASLMAVAGIRITSFEGFLGVYELPLATQYTITILAITGITNAFNLIDGIDGLAGGLGFMSLVSLGMFLTLSGDVKTALIAFALAGGLFAFLYFNLNPARIFMGDTGSLLVGFVIAVLCIRLMQVNVINPPLSPIGSPVFVLSIVLLPVFDTARVFSLRIWKGLSPFVADKSHIHHLLTNRGFSHSFTARVLCCLHGFILTEAWWLKNLRQEWTLLILIGIMLTAVVALKNLPLFKKEKKQDHFPIQKIKQIRL